MASARPPCIWAAYAQRVERLAHVDHDGGLGDLGVVRVTSVDLHHTGGEGLGLLVHRQALRKTGGHGFAPACGVRRLLQHGAGAGLAQVGQPEGQRVLAHARRDLVDDDFFDAARRLDVNRAEGHGFMSIGTGVRILLLTPKL